ncbi:MAG TPA: hypothetical protein VJN43_10585 [Bryobacteraceae bacterium]|nr:hypothetical protein [Bryobacteraceae bacterium]
MSEPAIDLTLSGAIPEGCTVFEPGEQAKGLLRNGITGQQYVDRLLEQKLFPDAVRFLACLLPKRQAVFWACQCAKRFYGGNPPPEKAAALAAAQKWIADPNDENRRAAMPAAQAAGLDNPAGCAALGAFFSGGSLGPPNVQPVPPGEFLTAKAVTGAVVLSIVSKEPEKAPEKFRAALAEALEIARRSNK